MILAERGKTLRFEGSLAVHMQGEIDAHLASVVDGVWHHFLIERFKPYIEEVAR